MRGTTLDINERGFLMADEYIKRDAAFSVLTEYYHHKLSAQHEALREALSRVHTADVQPVVRGKWVHHDNGEIRCSKCFSLVSVCNTKDFLDATEGLNYCYYCGADMRNDESAIF